LEKNSLMAMKKIFWAVTVIFASTIFGFTIVRVDTTKTGAISGAITVGGLHQTSKRIDMSKDPGCWTPNGAPPDLVKADRESRSDLQNIVVYISAGAPDEAAPKQVAILSQKGCVYLPRVLVVRAGQEIKILNEDRTVHNVHAVAKVNPEWNKFQLPGAPPIVAKFHKPEFITVTCSVHPWMRGTFAVVKNSHYFITGRDGKFRLPNLPTGTYTVTAWHEVYGAQSKEVSITGEETQTLNFNFPVKGK
jgi:plastocyanin